MSEVLPWIGAYIGETAALGAAVFWAVATLVYGRLGRFWSPAALNLLKNGIAVALLVLTMAVGGRFGWVSNTAAIGLLLASGAVGIGLGDTVYFAALGHLGPRRTLLLLSLAPPLSGLLAFLAMGETIGMAGWGGILLTVGGVTWVVRERVPAPGGVTGNLAAGIVFGLLAALAQAGGAVLSRLAMVSTGIGAMESSFLRLSGGALAVGIYLVWRRRPAAKRDRPSARQWGLLAAAVLFGTYLAIWLQQVSLQHTATGVAQTLFATSPVFVLPMVVAFMGERVSLRAVCGALVAVAGVGLLVW